MSLVGFLNNQKLAKIPIMNWKTEYWRSVLVKLVKVEFLREKPISKKMQLSLKIVFFSQFRSFQIEKSYLERQ